MEKQQIAVLCGGQSVEHEVSLLSASNVIRDLDRQRFDVIIIYIAKDGQWFRAVDEKLFLQQAQAMRIDTSTLTALVLVPGHDKTPFKEVLSQQAIPVDCVFPVLHGACGEDGTLQGLLEILNVAYVGCDTAGSAVCMDKHLSKQLLRHAGIPVLDWISLHRSEQHQFSFAEIQQQLAPVVFMKTVTSGSSIGVYKVRDETEYKETMAEIFDFDDNIIIEPAVTARELEVSVLGNQQLTATPPGEVLVFADFYTYEAKYFDPEASRTVAPAEASAALSARLQELALKAFRAVRGKGLARIDFLVVSDDEIYLNEINTMPGFTNISMYPKNWLAAGLSYKALLSRLIDNAFEVHANQQLIHANIKNYVRQQRERHSAG